MLIKINALKKPCPIPVIETKKAIRELQGKKGQIEVTVDNEVAIENIQKMTNDLNIPTTVKKQSETEFILTLEIQKENVSISSTPKEKEESTVTTKSQYGTVMVVGKDHLGEGDIAFGQQLIQNYFYSLTELEEIPDILLFFNGGIQLTTTGSKCLESIEILKKRGTKIYTCGACLDFYHKKEALEIGDITNMYAISQYMMKAKKVITL